MSESLKAAGELADQILQMTESLVLTGKRENEDEEVESYVNLMDEREPLIEELTDLRQQIADEEAASDEFARIKRTIEQITELDKKHLEFMQKKYKQVQGSYKEIKQGQRIHAGYNPLPGNEALGSFDIKQ